MEQRFDRAEEDLGNIVGLEHVNVLIPDQQIATLFYVTGLGLTRDPYLMTGLTNMWINVGRSQFHLPTGKPQVLRGVVGIVVPDRAALLQRLAAVRKQLAGTSFDFHEPERYVEAISPWGNRIRCHAPDPGFGRITLGLPYVQLDVPPDTVEGIVKFYRRVLDAPARIAKDDEGRHARIGAGDGQDLIFRETDGKLAPYDGHHIAIYVADFSGPHRRLVERGLISEESDQHQYRFQDITDTETGKVLYTVEHEVRSLRHPLYARPLVNRNPGQTNRNYVPGGDAWNWSVG
jgi:catechol 2,3-dioxygenase-like lactoylglutathione lyase family enzyme